MGSAFRPVEALRRRSRLLDAPAPGAPVAEPSHRGAAQGGPPQRGDDPPALLADPDATDPTTGNDEPGGEGREHPHRTDRTAARFGLAGGVAQAARGRGAEAMLTGAMGGKRAKSELERSVDGMAWSIRIQEAKRPETWLQWGGLVAAIQVCDRVGFVPGIAVALASTAGQLALVKRRVGAKEASQLIARMLPEVAAKNARRDLRQGRYDAKAGPEARAILERCAASANATIAASAETHLLNGGGRASLEAFRPLTRSAEEAMKAALARVQRATILKRPPDEEALADLRGIEASLAGLAGEAKALARSYRPAFAPPESATLAVEREAARRELDRGA